MIHIIDMKIKMTMLQIKNAQNLFWSVNLNLMTTTPHSYIYWGFIVIFSIICCFLLIIIMISLFHLSIIFLTYPLRGQWHFIFYFIVVEADPGLTRYLYLLDLRAKVCNLIPWPNHKNISSFLMRHICPNHIIFKHKNHLLFFLIQKMTCTEKSQQ